MKLQADSLHIARSGKEVLSGITFAVDSGEVYALLGGNGAGKSTTLLSFLGFLPPSSGYVRINDKDVNSDIVAARKVVAYLPESASLYKHLNAQENIRYFLQLAGASASQGDIDAALDRVSLAPEARQHKLRDYSKGMRQKVAIALAILRDTDILLPDEPTSGLDPSAIDEFHQMVRSLADSGKTILMVTRCLWCMLWPIKLVCFVTVHWWENLLLKGKKESIPKPHKAFSSTAAPSSQLMSASVLSA